MVAEDCGECGGRRVIVVVVGVAVGMGVTGWVCGFLFCLVGVGGGVCVFDVVSVE